MVSEFTRGGLCFDDALHKAKLLIQEEEQAFAFHLMFKYELSLDCSSSAYIEKGTTAGTRLTTPITADLGSMLQQKNVLQTLRQQLSVYSCYGPFANVSFIYVYFISGCWY